ncbi:T-cell surface glycoprotein CD3 epsilon chain [Clupea harengus]|uniref:T-cell surface glycoprotein CD3 epsilon chain n=1 Tax=Clupea harengus TaxID=7950 RepID=A0A6P8G161_CLUHA|nr:T-cell surface glycoprotein CD3 epsilon chain [Clupea harengus]
MVFKMKNLIFFLYIMTVAANKGSVSFSGTNVNIHCSEPGADLKKGEETFGNSRLTPYQDSDPAKLYHCMRTLDENGEQVEDPEKYLAFYIKAKVCENCYDIDGSLIVAAIFADLFITGGIIIMVYAYGQRKSGPAPQKPTHPRRNVTPSASPASQEYQSLSEVNRSKDLYSTVHKTG